MKKCSCGARWRTNYPFGVRSKGRNVFYIKHDKDCKYNKTKEIKDELE